MEVLCSFMHFLIFSVLSNDNNNNNDIPFISFYLKKKFSYLVHGE